MERDRMQQRQRPVRSAREVYVPRGGQPQLAGATRLPYSHQSKEQVLLQARKRRRRPWRIVVAVAAVVLVLSLAALGCIWFSYWNGQNSYDELSDALTVQEEGATLADFRVDWAALQAINPGVVAWIYVPGTVINYPVAYRSGDDEYYLDHNFYGDTSAFGAEYGSIMLAGDNDANFADQLNIIYGHNMRNGAMFACLNDFLDPAVFNSHRVFYLLTPAGNYELRSFAIDHIAGSATDIVRQNFPSTADLTAYIQARVDQSRVQPDPAAPAANTIPKVFAFSTCDDDNSYRNVVFCYVSEYFSLNGSDENAGTANIVDNESADLVNPDYVEGLESGMEERVS